jgi:dolichol-phosphate mannosyltransferase
VTYTTDLDQVQLTTPTERLSIEDAPTDTSTVDTSTVDTSTVDEAAAAPRYLNAVRPLGGSAVVTIVVPMRNEEENVPLLLQQLAAAFDGQSAELLVVDDSDDDTPSALVLAAATCPMPVRLLHRPDGARRGGLSSAVVTGARHTRSEWVLVMDADLQHPPEDAARLARTALWQATDVVIGTRYAGTGSGDGLQGLRRSAVSSMATRASRTAFPRRLATVSDPMSGLFAFRRAAVDLDRLHAVGFKLLLEILVRNPGARVSEVSYSFAPRNAGRSKASFHEGVTFLAHLARLRRAVLSTQLDTGPRSRAERLLQLVRALAFGLVGLTGVVVNTAVLWFCYHRMGMNAVLGAALATQASTLWNFGLTDLFVYRGPKPGTRIGRAGRFFVMNNLLLVLRLPVFIALVAVGVPVLAGNALTLALLFVVRFLVSDRVIYGAPDQPATVGQRDPVRMLVDRPSDEPVATLTDVVADATRIPLRKRPNYLTYRYDIAGILTLGSQIRLPELEFFRAQWVPDAQVDIAVRVGDVGRRTPRPRALMTQYVDGGQGEPVTLRYEEQLGQLGANFSVELGDTITVNVGPLMARSPHVVYTNVIEALLRFVMVSRGRMLLHSATVTLDGHGVMLSALTDTGKTATVLRLLREHGGKFLSDDMTIVDANGGAVCFPKPLTISAHTLRAVQADDLSKREWRRLQFQSRLHSKGGRSIAMMLAQFNLPIMGINALTQILVPPPKYSVDRLVSCQMGSFTAVKDLFIIERGAPRLAELGLEETLTQMLTNTDDAYGFPPFKYFAPAITIDGKGYRELREQEREILRSFLGHVRTRALASDCFGWADEIPRLLKEEGRINQVGTARGTTAHPERRQPFGWTVEEWPQWGAGAASPALP